MHDIVIRNATILDGTGAPESHGGIAVDGRTITAVGEVSARGRREIDAEGHLVTPGFVDIHTHFDGQASWDSQLAPSCWHGVTSAVMGNCGVGFAPVRPTEHEFLISLMEGVEDIPGAALAEGLTWDWETLPEYLDAIERRPHSIDLGAQIPHAALRAYVMGARGADNQEQPTDTEVTEMARLVVEALHAGYVGLGTSRTAVHRSRDGALIGTYRAIERELAGIAAAMRQAGTGVLQMVSDFDDVESEVRTFLQMARAAGRPASLTVTQRDTAPGQWRATLSRLEEAADAGLDVRAQTCFRPVGLLLGLDASLNPFVSTPSFGKLKDLPRDERLAAMRTDSVRRAMIEEFRQQGPADSRKMGAADPMPLRVRALDRLFLLGDPPNYEPPATDNLAARAVAAGRDPIDYVYDLLLAKEGQQVLYFPVGNYSNSDLDHVAEMIHSPIVLTGLSDAGAHVGSICDASLPTFNLTHWSRDREDGERFPLPEMIRRQTSDLADFVGWRDRGRLTPGYKADINVIDFDALRLLPPEMIGDLPAGGRRFVQHAEGYRYTICSGEVTHVEGEATGALPGRLVRGSRSPADPR